MEEGFEAKIANWTSDENWAEDLVVRLVCSYSE